MIAFDNTVDGDGVAPNDLTFRFEDLTSVSALEGVYDIVVRASTGQVPTS